MTAIWFSAIRRLPPFRRHLPRPKPVYAVMAVRCLLVGVLTCTLQVAPVFTQQADLQLKPSATLTVPELKAPDRIALVSGKLVVTNYDSEPLLVLLDPTARKVSSTLFSHALRQAPELIADLRPRANDTAGLVAVDLRTRRVTFLRIALDQRPEILLEGSSFAVPTELATRQVEETGPNEILVRTTGVRDPFIVMDSTGRVRRRFGGDVPRHQALPRLLDSYLGDVAIASMGRAVVAAGGIRTGEFGVINVATSVFTPFKDAPPVLEPQFDVRDYGYTSSLVPVATTRYGYHQVFRLGKHVGGLYSGRSFEEEGWQPPSQGHEIHVWDKDGKWLYRFRLGEPVRAIAASPDCRMVYGTSQGGEPRILVYRLPSALGC